MLILSSKAVEALMVDVDIERSPLTCVVVKVMTNSASPVRLKSLRQAAAAWVMLVWYSGTAGQQLCNMDKVFKVLYGDLTLTSLDLHGLAKPHDGQDSFIPAHGRRLRVPTGRS